MTKDEWYAQLFEHLGSSKFRSSFHLKQKGSRCPVDIGFEPTGTEWRPYAIHQSGRWYTNDNIDQMLMERHLGKKARRASGKNHVKGPRKRSEEYDIRFEELFTKIIRDALEDGGIS